MISMRDFLRHPNIYLIGNRKFTVSRWGKAFFKVEVLSDRIFEEKDDGVRQHKSLPEPKVKYCEHGIPKNLCKQCGLTGGKT